MKRAYSVDNVLNAKFKTLDFQDKWFDAFGRPSVSGTSIVLGESKNGKTSAALQFAKMLTQFGRVMYVPVEEKLSLSVKEALERVNMREVGSKFIMTTGDETVNELIERLNMHKSPQFVFLDSIQFMGLKFSEYKLLKSTFPNKRFIYVSHVLNGKPDGRTALGIYRDADMILKVEGFRMFPTGRYGGGETIDICKERANDYWGLKS